MDFPSQIWLGSYNDRGKLEYCHVSQGAGYFNSLQKCFVSRAFSFSLGMRVICLKRKQWYTHTVHQLSPHHRAKISFSYSHRLGGGQTARIWKSQRKVEQTWHYEKIYRATIRLFSLACATWKRLLQFEGSILVMAVNSKSGRETDAWFILTFPKTSVLPEHTLKFHFMKFPDYRVEMLCSSKKLCN